MKVFLSVIGKIYVGGTVLSLEGRQQNRLVLKGQEARHKVKRYALVGRVALDLNAMEHMRRDQQYAIRLWSIPLAVNQVADITRDEVEHLVEIVTVERISICLLIIYGVVKNDESV